MGLGGYSIVNVSWDCYLGAIFKTIELAWRLQSSVRTCTTQRVTSAHTCDITDMLLLTHDVLSSLTPSYPSQLCLLILSLSLFIQFVWLFSHFPPLDTHTLAHMLEVFDFGRLWPHSHPPTFVHMFYRNTHTSAWYRPLNKRGQLFFCSGCRSHSKIHFNFLHNILNTVNVKVEINSCHACTYFQLKPCVKKVAVTQSRFNRLESTVSISVAK